MIPTALLFSTACVIDQSGAGDYTNFTDAIADSCTFYQVACPASSTCTFNESLDFRGLGAVTVLAPSKATVVVDSGSSTALFVGNGDTVSIEGVDELTSTSQTIDIDSGTLDLSGTPDGYAYVRGTGDGIWARGPAILKLEGAVVDGYSTGIELETKPGGAPEAYLYGSVLSRNSLAITSQGCGSCTNPYVEIEATMTARGDRADLLSYIWANTVVLDTPHAADVSINHTQVVRNGPYLSSCGVSGVGIFDLSSSTTLAMNNVLMTDNDSDPAGSIYATTGCGGHLFKLDDSVAVSLSSTNIIGNQVDTVFDWQASGSAVVLDIYDSHVAYNSGKVFSMSKLPGSTCGAVNEARATFDQNWSSPSWEVYFPTTCAASTTFVTRNQGARLAALIPSMPPSKFSGYQKWPGGWLGPHVIINPYSPVGAPPIPGATYHPAVTWSTDYMSTMGPMLDVGFKWPQ